MVEENIPESSLNAADLPNGKGKRESRKRENDPSWYTRVPNLVPIAANFPFGAAVGTRVNLVYPNTIDGDGNLTQAFTSSLQSAPGIMTIHYVPTIGSVEEQSTSAINMAAIQLFAYQRSRNSRSASYDAPDLMMYFLAMRSAYALYAKMVRIYGTMNLASPLSRYLPVALVKAQGVDYDDLMTNMAQFHYLVNQFAYKLGQLNMPAGMSVIDRNIWLNSNIFMDSSTPKSQIYLYDQSVFHRYSEANENTAATLIPKYWEDFAANKTKGMTVSEMSTLVTDILQPLLESEDIGTISADILKAYGLENCISVSPIAENYMVMPTWSKEVLSQIENTWLAGSTRILPDRTEIPNTTNLIIQQVIPPNELGSPYLDMAVCTVDPTSQSDSKTSKMRTHFT